jgi:transcriptional regulator with XRE-family HTH domain
VHARPSPHSRQHDAFGRAVRETRARRGLSQEALGHAARLHRNCVGAIERGEINPTFRVIIKLAAGLGVDVSELVQLAEKRSQEPPVPITLPNAQRGPRR